MSEQLMKPGARDGGGSTLGHMPAIDALRGIAIVIVMFHHFAPAVSGSASTRRMLELMHTGWVGVDLFFVLSGFLITSILLKTRNGEDYFLNFFARRTLRIFPLYYLALAVVLVALPAMLQVPILGPTVQHWFGRVTRDLPTLLTDQGWLWLYGTNLKIAVGGERWGAVNHFWSLAVEEHFYLFWPVVVYFVRSRQKLIRVCLVCILGAPLLRAMLMMAGFDSVVPYVLTPCRVDSLAIGALLSLVILRPNGVQDWTRRLTWMSGLAIVGLVTLVACYGRFHRDDLMTSFVGYSLVATVAAWLVLLCARIRSGTLLCRVVANPVLTSLGRYSYGIYLTHMFFAGVFATIFDWATLHHLTGSYKYAILINATLSAACSWGIAWVIFHAVEKHFLRLKTFFEYRRSQPVARPVTRPVPAQAAAGAVVKPLRLPVAPVAARQAA